MFYVRAVQTRYDSGPIQINVSIWIGGSQKQIPKKIFVKKKKTVKMLNLRNFAETHSFPSQREEACVSQWEHYRLIMRSRPHVALLWTALFYGNNMCGYNIRS